jgi:hypothetical protein
MAYQATVRSNRRRYVVEKAEHIGGVHRCRVKDEDFKKSELGLRRLCCVPSAETAERLHTECTAPFRDVSS